MTGSRAAGILLPVSSLPSHYGIGTLGREAYRFVDMLKLAKQSYWQILPTGPTSYGDSPYQSFSAFAGNPYFIDLELLIEQGLLTKKECRPLRGEDDAVNYEKQYQNRFLILRKAFLRRAPDEGYAVFCGENAFWLNDYALYMAIKSSQGDRSWQEWDNSLKMRDPESLDRCRVRFAEDIEFYRYIQYVFFIQWRRLKDYANKQGIKLIGDIPIYVALDSADTWGSPGLFMLDKTLTPTVVSGCPPDAFSEDGQLWGNPIYNWANLEKQGFDWWIKRLKHASFLYDTIRIDHFRGFDAYYTIPYGRTDAKVGKWVTGPGMKLFNVLSDKLGELDIIAEDLGLLTDSVKKLLSDTGYPGMKVLQFAFSAGQDNDYLPHNHIRNSVVYTGTHDNETTLSWLNHQKKKDRVYLCSYINKDEAAVWDVIRMAYASPSYLAIIPMQDYLELDNRARMNRPSTISGNWEWRLPKDAFTKKLASRMRKLCKLYHRQPAAECETAEGTEE